MADIGTDKVITAFVKLRDQRAALKREYEEADGALKEKMAKLQTWLAQQMAAINSDQLSCPVGTAYREIDTKYSAADWGLVWQYMQENDRPDLLQKRLSESAITEIYNETGELPPGINIFQEYVVKIRRK